MLASCIGLDYSHGHKQFIINCMHQLEVNKKQHLTQIYLIVVVFLNFIGKKLKTEQMKSVYSFTL